MADELFVFTSVTYRHDGMEFGVKITGKEHVVKVDYPTAKDYDLFLAALSQQTGYPLKPTPRLLDEKATQLRKAWNAMVDSEVWKKFSQN